MLFLHIFHTKRKITTNDMKHYYICVYILQSIYFLSFMLVSLFDGVLQTFLSFLWVVCSMIAVKMKIKTSNVTY